MAHAMALIDRLCKKMHEIEGARRRRLRCEGYFSLSCLLVLLAGTGYLILSPDRVYFTKPTSFVFS
jgi:hypothetical protein